MSDQFDQWASWVPEIPMREEQPVYDLSTPSSLYAFDGSDSLSAIDAAPKQSIPPWDKSTSEWRVVISHHPVSEARLRDAFREAEKRYGQIKSIAAYVEKGFGDAQTIQVLRHLAFVQSHARATPHAVCYVKDLKKKTDTPKIEPAPVVEPTGWAKELEVARKRVEYKKLRGTLTEKDLTEIQWYEQQVEKDKNAARSESVQAIDAEIEAIERQVHELQKQMHLPPPSNSNTLKIHRR
jgi:hypothetical protein